MDYANTLKIINKKFPKNRRVSNQRSHDSLALYPHTSGKTRDFDFEDVPYFDFAPWGMFYRGREYSAQQMRGFVGKHMEEFLFISKYFSIIYADRSPCLQLFSHDSLEFNGISITFNEGKNCFELVRLNASLANIHSDFFGFGEHDCGLHDDYNFFEPVCHFFNEEELVEYIQGFIEQSRELMSHNS